MPLILYKKMKHAFGDSSGMGCHYLYWIAHILKFWRAKASQETLHKELMRVKEKSVGMYDFVLRQLLAWVADAGDKDTFCWLLDNEEAEGFCIRAVYNSIMEDINSMLIEKVPELVTSLFITEKEEFLDEIVKRSGISRIRFSSIQTYFEKDCEGNFINSDLPESYLAVLRGNLHMAEYFSRREGYGSGYMKDDYLSSPDSLWGGSFTYLRKDLGMNVLWLGETADLLTAALDSGSGEMIEFILKNYPDIVWNQDLYCHILCTDERNAKLILKYHPELFEFLDIKLIIASRHCEFLGGYLTECGKQGRDLEKELLESEFEKLKQQQLFREWSNILPEKSVVPFYQKVFSVFADNSVKREFLRMLFIDYQLSAQEALVELFLKHRDMEHDFSDYLDIYPAVVQKMQDGKVKYGFEILSEFCTNNAGGSFPVDLYKENMYFVHSLSKRMLKKLLRVIVPLKIENAPDVLFQRIAELNDEVLVRDAIKRGFITGENRVALLAEAKRLHAGYNIKIALMDLAETGALADRYEW